MKLPLDSIRLFVALVTIALVTAAAGQVASPPSAPLPNATPPNAATPLSTAQPAAAPPASPANSQAPVDLQIGSGDLLEISVFGHPEFKQEQRVSGTGEITLPLIGSLKVDGLTIGQAQSTIRKKLVDGGYYKDPAVSVFAKEYATQGVSVLGEVNKPGVYPRLGQRRLLDVISAAGGLTQKAGRAVTITRRNNPTVAQTLELSKEPEKAMVNNVEVYPGDTVVVSQAGVVYVIGDVAKPSGFVMDNNESMTVLQAIALAGGTNNTASLERTRLIRKRPEGAQEISVALKRIMEAKAEDVPLQAGDVLFVPNSAGKSAARRGMEAILQAATGVAIYRR
jgi:polysaccharide export outer membrane protein